MVLVLPMVLVLVLLVLLVLVLLQVLVLLACRWQLRGKRKMGVDCNMTPLLRVSLPREI